MPPRLRLFIAVDPPSETAVQAGRIIERLKRLGLDATWVNPAHLHLTLHFLGNNVDEADLHGICVAMNAACASLPPIDVAFGGVGAFPDAKNPRTIWLGVREGIAGLVALHDALATQLEPLGFPAEERRYRPHVTLGRLRREKGGGPLATTVLAEELERLTELAAGTAEIAEVTLYASRLDRDGPEHEKLHVADLQGR